MNKKAVLLKIVGFSFIIISFIYNNYSILRLISVLIGIILIGLGIKLKKNNYKTVLFVIGILLIIMIADYLSVRYLNRIPLISYEIKSSEEFSTYNSLIYRVYNCDGELVFDNLYKKNYMCDVVLKEENVNALLPSIANDFKKYRNKFVNVNGKISSIAGSTSISMQIFETNEKTLNGQVNFSDDITLVIINNGNLENVEELKVYDTINIIGRIAKIRKNGQNKEIVMEDAKIVNRSDLNSYEINVIENKSCEKDLKLMSKTDSYTYYSTCLDSIYVKYNDETIYDLDYVLTDKRMNFEQLTESAEKEEDENAEIYKLNNFNVIKCKNSNNVVIGNKKLQLKNNYCESFKNIENSEDFEGI